MQLVALNTLSKATPCAFAVTHDRAKKTGVSSDELEDAEDNDDYKGAIVELVVAREVAAAASQTARGGKGAEPGSIPGLVSASAGAEGAASPKDAAKLYDRARTLRRQGSYDVAILAYTDSISAEHPDLAKCLNERGVSQLLCYCVPA